MGAEQSLLAERHLFSKPANFYLLSGVNSTLKKYALGRREANRKKKAAEEEIFDWSYLPSFSPFSLVSAMRLALDLDLRPLGCYYPSELPMSDRPQSDSRMAGSPPILKFLTLLEGAGRT